MISLKEAIKLDKNGLIELYEKLDDNIAKGTQHGAYIEQLKNQKIQKLHSGVPIAIKDIINVKDQAMSCASNILDGYIAPYNATVIQKLLTIGLAPYGRTNMDEFAMGSDTTSGYFGKTTNPHDSTKTAGGSSGGSACAVASGQAIAALGTDTGGSIRQPACYCGVVGMKPTYGRVSRYGITAYSSSLDQCGPITNSVEDSAILYDIISGYDDMDSTSANIKYNKIAPNINSKRKLKIAIIDEFLNDASSEIKKAFYEVVELLKKDGHEIINQTMMDTKKHISTYYVIATAEASANLSRFDGVRYGNQQEASNLNQLYENTKSKGFGKEVQKRILLGSFVLSSGYYDAYYIKAQKVRHIIKDEFETIFSTADLILSPVAPTTAPKIGAYKNSLDMYLSDIYTISTNLAGLPAISVPVSKDKDDMPIGLQFIGKQFDEQTIFDGAKRLEELVNFRKDLI
ncbi:MAG: Asp-tRNA(Asn)/Glu-tRNA(Gln) amidotransferase GatCAB subunit A [Epsilonproteobacteria bacterium]|nr:MAG: Asp-tRNA(Asn)/Glu-tRNA(Gln) amidotransferase GatCAB subunit A [Campylobacterota bacterium]